MRRVLAIGLLLLALAAFAYAAEGQQPANNDHIDPWFKPMTVTFKDTPLPQAIEQLTKGLGVNYKFSNISTDPAELKVTAVFRNVPLEAALKQTITGAGLNYSRMGDELSIWDPAWLGVGMGGYQQKVDPKDYWKQEVKSDFKDIAFGEAIKKLFWGTPATYTVPEDVLDLKVTFSADAYTSYPQYRTRSGQLYKISEQANVRYAIDGDKIAFELGRPQSTYMKNGHWTVYRSFSDTAFNKAIEALFRGTNILYRIKPGLEDAKVTANLGEMPLDEALKQVLDAAGATLTKEDETYVFGPAAGSQVASVKPIAVVSSDVASQKEDLDEYGLSPLNPEYTKNETIELKYVDASAVLPLAQLQPDLRIAKTGKRFVTVHGRLKEIQRFKDVVALVDKPESLPRAVRVTFRLVIDPQATLPDTQRLQPLEAENLVAEGMQGTSKVNAQFESLTMTVSANVIDPRPEDNRTLVSLAGQGTIAAMNSSRTFDILKSLEPGKETTIASGNMQISNMSVPFSVMAIATIEADRVYLPTNDLQIGNNRLSWSPDGKSYSNAPLLQNQLNQLNFESQRLQQSLNQNQQTQQGSQGQQNAPGKP